MVYIIIIAVIVLAILMDIFSVSATTKEKRLMQKYAEEIVGYISIYNIHASVNPPSPYTEGLRNSIVWKWEEFDKFLTACRDSSLANEVKLATRLLLFKKARITVKTSLAKV